MRLEQTQYCTEICGLLFYYKSKSVDFAFCIPHLKNIQAGNRINYHKLCTFTISKLCH